jgi:hypothetical protein
VRREILAHLRRAAILAFPGPVVPLLRRSTDRLPSAGPPALRSIAPVAVQRSANFLIRPGAMSLPKRKPGVDGADWKIRAPFTPPPPAGQSKKTSPFPPERSLTKLTKGYAGGPLSVMSVRPGARREVFSKNRRINRRRVNNQRRPSDGSNQTTSTRGLRMDERAGGPPEGSRSVERRRSGTTGPETRHLCAPEVRANHPQGPPTPPPPAAFYS